MAKTFDFSNPPFDRLRPAEVERVDSSVDVVFFRTGHTILKAGDLPDHLYIIIKGLVEERSGSEVVAVHEAGEAFDSGILIHQVCRHDFVVREEVICYTLPIEDFLELTANNQPFAAFFFKDISHKLETLSQRQAGPHALGALTMRLTQTHLHPPVIVPPETTLHEAACLMDRHGQRALLIQDGDRLGILTGLDLTRVAVAQRQPLETPVASIGRYAIHDIDEESFLFEAALVMARHRIRHLVVRRQGQLAGILDAATVLSSLANQSDAIGAIIERAQRIEDLTEASERVTLLIRQLHDSGTKIGFITDLSTDLHRRMTAKLFDMLAPEGFAAHACLIVMGSEGRGEYLLKTDQDNGLIVADGHVPPGYDTFRQRFTERMIEVGFPACPGEIMVRNPAWSMPLAEWREAIRTWVLTPGEQALMNVAIFYDAAPAAGEASLLDAAKGHLFELLAENSAFHARFAKAIDMFDTPLGLFSSLLGGRGEHKDEIDLKKGGIFPLMHGVRALSLERQLTETNTVRRIRRLQELNLFDQTFAQQLVDAFSFLTALRLSARLEKMRLHRPLDNFIRPNDITKLERDLLKDSLQIVKRLKELVRHHFHLGLFA